MPTVSDTAYPPLKSHPTERELELIYTPTAEKHYLAPQSTKGQGPISSSSFCSKPFSVWGILFSYRMYPPPLFSTLSSRARPQWPTLPWPVMMLHQCANVTPRVAWLASLSLAFLPRWNRPVPKGMRLPAGGLQAGLRGPGGPLRSCIPAALGSRT